jgi:hypothetical protein
MSLLWPASEQDIILDKPRLHALVIGVADYPHLINGRGLLATNPLGLSQVSTPRHTAIEIAKWVSTNYNNTNCPLGSLEVLVSPGTTFEAIPGQPTTETATLQAIELAFNRWFARASANPGNMAFFYFCGHGLQKLSQYILPEDFGDPNYPDMWRNCIDFDAMRTGMGRCKAQTQIFFVDACRETPFGMLTQLGISGRSLCNADVTETANCSATYYATGQGKKAYGPDNGNTYFSQAVLSCLNGVGAVKRMGKWVVDTYSLSGALGQIMAQLAQRHKLPLTCNPNATGMAQIHESPEARVMAVVQCSSKNASDVAEIQLQNGTATYLSAVGDPKPLIEEVNAGDWTIDVRFPGGEFPVSPPSQHTLMPPVFEGLPIP